MKRNNIIKRLINKFTSTDNTIKNNLSRWDEYDWSNYGEEWSNNPEWKESVVNHIIVPNIPIGSRILEIGPGGGRWTEFLINRGSRVVLVDLTPKCIEICKERFANYSNIDYFVNDGKNLDFIFDSSIDRIWSWDVFVHIQSKDIRNYLQQFEKKLVSGGRGVIHHSKHGINKASWRSDMTASLMKNYCDEFDLKLLVQFDSWGNGKFQIWPDLPPGEGPDIVSIIEKL